MKHGRFPGQTVRPIQLTAVGINLDEPLVITDNVTISFADDVAMFRIFDPKNFGC